MKQISAVLALALLSACTSPSDAPPVLSSVGPGDLSAAQGRALPPPASFTSGDTTVEPVQVASAQPGQNFQELASQFDPDKQRFIWVLPQGVHGVGPWDMAVKVTHRGEVKFESSFPLKAEIVPPGSRPEYKAGAETVRLTDGGLWRQRAGELDKVIADLIQQHGRGGGEVEMQNELHVSIDPPQRKAYCEDGAQPDIQLYVEEDSKPLIRMDIAAMKPIFAAVVRKACKG
jgi:hypothetical protein